MNIDVSVVVPVYNTEKYLPECVESLIRQTLRNVEFIFVDDGSTDRSVEIIEEYKKQDERIKLIKQKNQYAGVARNNGMKAATGKYIIFLDSDDFFELNMLEEAFNCAEKNRAEIVVFGSYYYDEASRAVSETPTGKYPEGCVSFEQMGEPFFQSYYGWPWNKLFLRSFIEKNELRFQAIRKHNDTVFTNLSAYLAKRVVFLNRRFVYYRVGNTDSLQGNMTRERSAIITAQKALKQEMLRRGLFYGAYKDAYCKNLCKALRYYGNLQGEQNSVREFFETLKQALIPELFDSPEDFAFDEWMTRVYRCTSFEDYLWYRICALEDALTEKNRQLKRDYISRRSKEFWIGHCLLAVPRLVTHVFRKGKR